MTRTLGQHLHGQIGGDLVADSGDILDRKSYVEIRNVPPTRTIGNVKVAIYNYFLQRDFREVVGGIPGITADISFEGPNGEYRTVMNTLGEDARVLFVTIGAVGER